MTCPTLLLRRPLPAGALPGEWTLPVADRVQTLRTRDDVLGQFLRFLFAGGLANVLYAALFLSLAPFGDQAANLAGAIASSALANELHRRLTFRAGGRVSWLAAQWAGGSLALAGWTASSIALGVLAASGAAAVPVLQVALVLSVTAAVGLARFVALRFVFRPRAQPAVAPEILRPPAAAPEILRAA